MLDQRRQFKKRNSTLYMVIHLFFILVKRVKKNSRKSCPYSLPPVRQGYLRRASRRFPAAAELLSMGQALDAVTRARGGQIGPAKWLTRVTNAANSGSIQV
jgi:hypothetical protein